MLVTFLRHAEAEDAVTTDFDRRLTAKGLEQADKAGRFCVRCGLIPDVIVTSPVVRAEQILDLDDAPRIPVPLGEPPLLRERLPHQRVAGHGHVEDDGLVVEEPILPEHPDPRRLRYGEAYFFLLGLAASAGFSLAFSATSLATR